MDALKIYGIYNIEHRHLGKFRGRLISHEGNYATFTVLSVTKPKHAKRRKYIRHLQIGDVLNVALYLCSWSIADTTESPNDAIINS